MTPLYSPTVLEIELKVKEKQEWKDLTSLSAPLFTLFIPISVFCFMTGLTLCLLRLSQVLLFFPQHCVKRMNEHKLTQHKQQNGKRVNLTVKTSGFFLFKKNIHLNYLNSSKQPVDGCRMCWKSFISFILPKEVTSCSHKHSQVKVHWFYRVPRHHDLHMLH